MAHIVSSFDGKWVLYYGAHRVAESTDEAEIRRLFEARKPFVVQDDRGWSVFDAEGLLLDSFATEAEAERYAASGPRKSAGLVTDRMRREAKAGTVTPAITENLMPREICKACNEVSAVGFTVPDNTWAQAVPDHLQKHALCVRCFTKFADEKSLQWDGTIEFHPVSAVTSDAVDSTLEATPEQATEAPHPGAMVALMVPADVAQALAAIVGPAGESASELHLTLAFLGDAADLTPEQQQAVHDAAQATAERFYAVQGQISGIGRFSADDAPGEGDPVYASYDAPVLPALRQFLVAEIEARGVEVRKDHGFTPHITLQYLPGAPPAENVIYRLPVTECNFSAITVVMAGERRDFEFIGHVQEACESATFHVEEAEFFERPHTPAGSIWDVVLIRSGWSKNGNYYTPESLREACARGVFNCDIFGYGSPDNRQGMGHLSDAARYSGKDMVRDKAGWTTDSFCRVAEDGRTEVAAVFHWVDPVLRARMVEAWAHGNRHFLGFSIDGDADRAMGTAEGRRGAIVTRISALYETTLVSNPAAGGRFERLVAAVNHDTNKQQEDPKMNRLRTFLRARLQESQRAAIVDTLDEKGVVEAAFSHVKEMAGDDSGFMLLLSTVKEQLDAGQIEVASSLLGKLLDAMGAAATAKPAEQPMVDEAAPVTEAAKAATQPTVNAELQATLAAIKESEARVQEGLKQIRVEKCAAVLNRHLTESKLPAPAQDFIREQYEGKEFEEARLLESIDKQRTYLASVMGGGDVQVGKVQMGLDERDRQELIMDVICGYRPAQEEAAKYRGIHGKRNSIRTLHAAMADQRVLSRVGESRIWEATSADFAYVLGTSMEKAMVQAYRETEDKWRPLVSINPNVDNFKDQKRVRWNEFSGLPVFTESTSTDVTDIGFPSDDETTYAVSSHQGMVTITRTMIINDDLDLLSTLPRAIGRGAMQELRTSVFALIIGNYGGGGINTDTIDYTGNVIYHANHFNTKTTALSPSALDAAWAQMQNQYAYGQKTLVNGSSFNNTTDPVQITVDSTAGFFAGKYIVCGAEICSITTVDSSTQMTVVRAQFGTTAAAHADNAPVYQLGRALDVGKIFIVAPVELRGTLDKCLRSEKVAGTANNDVNLLQSQYAAGMMVPIIVNRSYLGGDATNWYMVADPLDIPGIELAFLNNRQEPEIIVQNGPTEGNSFTRDNWRYKCRLEWGGVQLDPKALQGNIVSG